MFLDTIFFLSVFGLWLIVCTELKGEKPAGLSGTPQGLDPLETSGVSLGVTVLQNLTATILKC